MLESVRNLHALGAPLVDARGGGDLGSGARDRRADARRAPAGRRRRRRRPRRPARAPHGARRRSGARRRLMAEIVLDRVTKVFAGGVLGGRRRVAADRGRRVHGPRRPVRLRQVDAASADRRASRRSTRARSRSAAATSPTCQPRERDIAMVFQSYALYPHMTVRQNLGYGLKVRRPPKQETRRARRARSPGCSGSTSCSTAGRRRSRAGSASASRWAARSCVSRRPS